MIAPERLRCVAPSFMTPSSCLKILIGGLTGRAPRCSGIEAVGHSGTRVPGYPGTRGTWVLGYQSTARALIQDHLRSGQGPCVSLFSSMFGRFSTPAGTETHPDRQDLTRSAFCTKNQPLTFILRPIRDRFPIWSDPCPAFLFRVVFLCLVAETRLCVSVDVVLST